MTRLVGSLMVPQSHRLYDPLNRILLFSTTFSIAFHCTYFKAAPNFERGHAATFYSKQFPRRIYLPQWGIFEAAMAGDKLSQIEVVLKNEADPDELGLVPGRFLPLLSNIITPNFVQFFEDHREWLETNIPIDKWPAVLSFSRVVRNAISHGGKCDIRGKKAVPVSWHHLTYGLADNGKMIINADLIFADLLILMFEMSEALDAAGCPSP